MKVFDDTKGQCMELVNVPLAASKMAQQGKYDFCIVVPLHKKN